MPVFGAGSITDLIVDLPLHRQQFLLDEILDPVVIAFAAIRRRPLSPTVSIILRAKPDVIGVSMGHFS